MSATPAEAAQYIVQANEMRAARHRMKRETWKQLQPALEEASAYAQEGKLQQAKEAWKNCAKLRSQARWEAMRPLSAMVAATERGTSESDLVLLD